MTHKAKDLIRELVAELRVNSKAEILPSYYLNGAPAVCETSEKVDPTWRCTNQPEMRGEPLLV